MALHSAVKGKLISVIGDEDTCVGFLLGGVGEINKNRHPNFMVVDKSKFKCKVNIGNTAYHNIVDQQKRTLKIYVFISDTPIGEIEDCFKRFIKRDDIDIILINQSYAELIRHVIDAHTSPLPAVLEIPSKDHPYDASKDSILRRAKVCSNNKIFSKHFFSTKLPSFFLQGMFNPEDMVRQIQTCFLFAALYYSFVC